MMRALAIGLFGLLFCGTSLPAQTVTFESLLDEMTDRDRLARWPGPAYTCRQASSYDRDTVAPDQPGWFANWDRSQFVRTEQNGDRTEHVMMDVDGPGAIVRLWATWHGPGGGKFSNGTLRVYLDNQPEPVIEGPAEDIIDKGALVGPPLSQGVSPETNYDQRGHNLYLPIPYASHCKVTYETSVLVDRGARKGEALYYQINYRTYEPGTDVESFQMAKLDSARAKIDQVQQRLLQSGHSGTAELQTAVRENCAVADDSCSLTIDGPAAIRQVSIKLDAENLAQALRSTVLAMEFDGRRTVWAPVGEFFGIGYRFTPYRTWYTEVQEDGTLNCYWTMPFETNCRVRLLNCGDTPVKAALFRLRHGDWQWDDRSMHFHSTWHQLTKVDTRRGSDSPYEGAYDVNYVKVHGQGVYAGDTLTVFNGAKAWWGEGDEKIYVDGESFPSHVGTGTEDYYGYAWCRPAPFDAPFHAQPTGSGNLEPGFSVNSRYRALDAIPFTSQFRMDMELWHWAITVVNYAPTTFWYARPGATWNVEPAPETAAKAVALKRTDVVEPFLAENAVEGERMKVVSKTGGTTEIQQVGQFRWSNDAQLWWREGEPGDRLVLEFPVDKAGRYRVLANLTKAVDYGIVRVQVNDAPAKQFDRFHGRVAHDKLELGTLQLPAGTNRLTVEIIGANEQAVPKHMFGLDYLQLMAQP